MALSIKCCKDCVAPKRHPGCHATCKEYIDEKAQLEKDKEKAKAGMERFPRMKAYDFDVNAFSSMKSRRRHRRH